MKEIEMMERESKSKRLAFYTFRLSEDDFENCLGYIRKSCTFAGSSTGSKNLRDGKKGRETGWRGIPSLRLHRFELSHRASRSD